MAPLPAHWLPRRIGSLCHCEQSEESMVLLILLYDEQMLPDFAGAGRYAQHDKMDFFSDLLNCWLLNRK